jgi:hypothetical protein
MVELAVVLKEGRGGQPIIGGLEEGPGTGEVGGQPLYKGEIALDRPRCDEPIDGVGNLGDEYHRAYCSASCHASLRSREVVGGGAVGGGEDESCV